MFITEHITEENINKALRAIRKPVAVAAMLLLGLQTLTACSSAASVKQSEQQNGGNTELTTIQIPAKDGSLCGAPLFIAQELGFYKEEGIKAELTTADVETRKIGLNNGTIPVVNGDFQFFQSIENGVKVKIVDGLHYGCIKFIVRNDSTLSKPEDFKGKKIAVNEIGDTPQQVSSLWLEQGGVNANPSGGDVTFLPFADANLQLEALKSGQVDMAAVWDPVGSVQQKNGEVKVIFDLAKDPVLSKHFCCFLYASDKVLKENPKLIASIVRANRKAEDWISKNPEKTVQLIKDKKFAEVDDVELATQLIKDYRYLTAEQSANADVKGDLEYFATELGKLGYLKSTPEEFTAKTYQKIDLNS